MQKTIAYMNHGRWLHNCLECDTPLPADKDICPICFPDIQSTLLQHVRGKLYRPVPDVEKRGQVRSQAASNNKLYKPDYPAQREQIERVLRERKRENMNWEPGETLEMLIADNIRHGDPLPPGMELRHAV